MDVKATGSELQFGLHLDNGSDGKVTEVRYPMIGGLGNFGAPGKPADGVICNSDSAPMKIDAAFKAHTFEYPWAFGDTVNPASMAWSCIQSATAKRTLYFTSQDPIARYKIYHFEAQVKDNLKDVFASIEHVPFTPPSNAFDGSPVVLKFVDGDWHAATHLYQAWFEKCFGICKPSQSWLRGESFFLFTMFELPEGTINFRFKDIPQWAKSAKDHGINSVQISGWQVGGHDNGYPDYTPDPRLGTWKELEDGIKACHQMGLKVYFFANYQPVMKESNWYKKDLYKYLHWDDTTGQTARWGQWPMGTLWGRMGHGKIMVWADPGFPEYRKIIVDQFAKLAQIGADGVHIDKMMPTAIDYNPELPMSPDAGPWEGSILLTKEIFTACRKYNPDWAMSFESNWDLLNQFTCSHWWGYVPGSGGIFPDCVGTQGITSAYDYLGVNSLICQRSTVLVGPMNFCRSLDWKPWEGLANYIKEVKRIQDSLADTVWLGDALTGEEAQLSGNISSASYVYRNRTTGKRVAIFSNVSRSLQKQRLQGFQNHVGGQVRIHTPFQEARVVSLPAEIDVPGERIVFVEEL